MVGEEKRKPDELAGSEKNIFQQMLNQVTDFASSLLNMGKPKENGSGEQQKQPTDQFLEKTKELASNAVKGVVDAGDSVLKSLKLDENEMVQNLQKQAKDFLKQLGLLEEEFENEDYY